MTRQESVVRPAEVVTWLLVDDGSIPNNPDLPLLLYRQAFALPERDPASMLESVFTANKWPAAWRYGIFPFHHYHSTAHEVLGVFRGHATVLFGGASGITARVGPGDVIIIPAGVGHKLLEASTGFTVVGAYPAGTRADLCRGRENERPTCLEAIARVAIPGQDPVYGVDGPLQKYWLKMTASAPDN